MHAALVFMLLTLSFIALPATAQDRRYVDYGWLSTNDITGDTHDRWQTGSLTASVVWGPKWQGSAPKRLGQLIELRFGTQVIAPENLTNPAPGDRPFAGVLSLGLHSHVTKGAMEYTVGGDLFATGPQTGSDDAQRNLHEILGGRIISQSTRDNQVANDLNPSFVFETGRRFQLSKSTRLRPFLEVRAGFETLLRVGADMTIGTLGRNGLMVREFVSGHRFEAVSGPEPGMSFVVGADIAHVSDSEVLSGSRGIELSDTRNRVRAGIHYRRKGGSSIFYGVTWLDREFKGQRESQFVGSLGLRLKF